ncbi:MAG: hypothetical protein EOM02_09645 [Synergistales bacterium]|nr:hypothetical protein [Synergistales bacterium]
MAVRRVDTLGCHPLVLMQKLAAIGGLEIMREEKHTHDGVDYPYHIIAKVKDGLYVEAFDPIYAVGDTPEKMPTRPGGLLLEATDLNRSEGMANLLTSDREMKFGNVSWGDFERKSMSVLITLPTHPSRLKGRSDSYLFGFYAGVGLNKDAFVITGELKDGETITTQTDSNICYKLTGPVREGNYAHPFGIINFGWRSSPPRVPSTHALQSAFLTGQERDVCAPVLLVLSGAMVRVGHSFSEGAGIALPTEWEELPIFTSIMSSDSGLSFIVPSSRGAILVLTTVDTTKGNGFEGVSPVIFCKIPLAHNPGSKLAERAVVLGSASNPAASAGMSLYSPTPPIGNDSVSGGPVVTDVFVHNLDEIRGAIPGVLSCSPNLPMGTVGWLDGKRYRVHLPGRMLQIG